MTKPKKKPSWLLVLPVLTLLLSACATRSNDLMPVQPPAFPSLPPSLAKPVPPESYSERAQTNIGQWQKKLTEDATK